MFKKILYGIIAILFLALWGATAFGQTTSSNTVTVAGITHHRQPKLNLPSKEPDPLAKYTISTEAKEMCMWLLGASALYMVICPLAAWEITIPKVRVKHTSKKNQGQALM